MKINYTMNTSTTFFVSYQPCPSPIVYFPGPQFWLPRSVELPNARPFLMANNTTNGVMPATHTLNHEGNTANRAATMETHCMYPVVKDANLDQQLKFLAKSVLSHKYSELTQPSRPNSIEEDGLARKINFATDELSLPDSRTPADANKVELKKLIIKRCTQSERIEKMKKYKAKLKKWREAHPINRYYVGRRKNALRKARANGRFATATEIAAGVAIYLN